MTKFKIGDLVVCANPVPTMMHRLNVRARVTGVVGNGEFLELSRPYDNCAIYTSTQFKKCNPELENK